MNIYVPGIAFSVYGYFIPLYKTYESVRISNYIYTLGQKVDRDLLPRISRFLGLTETGAEHSFAHIPALIR